MDWAIVTYSNSSASAHEHPTNITRLPWQVCTRRAGGASSFSPQAEHSQGRTCNATASDTYTITNWRVSLAAVRKSFRASELAPETTFQRKEWNLVERIP